MYVCVRVYACAYVCIYMYIWYVCTCECMYVMCDMCDMCVHVIVARAAWLGHTCSVHCVIGARCLMHVHRSLCHTWLPALYPALYHTCSLHYVYSLVNKPHKLFGRNHDAILSIVQKEGCMPVLSLHHTRVTLSPHKTQLSCTGSWLQSRSQYLGMRA
jgi:hypothetical protein